MELILNETIDTLGREGDIVNVKAGFGRNYLLPKGKAVAANAGNIAVFEKNKANIEARIKDEMKASQALAKKLAGTTLTIPMLAGSDKRLFGSVTNSDISKQLADNDIDINKKQILLIEPIKSLGESTVVVKVGFQERVDIIIKVVPLAEDDGEGKE